MVFEKRQLPKKSESLAHWYNAVVLLAELADYGPAKGTMIFRPHGYRIWELIQEVMDKEIKKSGVENAYFPLFIPESLMHKEKEHVEGFAPQLAVVTIGGGEELKEKLVVRPTSETIMYQAYAKWIQSWRDLPMLINQWNNVVRWEKRTYLFLRTTEFLWQEGHCAHATHQESQERVQWAIDMYAQIYRDWLSLPGIIGKKSESEKFAGGDATLTYEILMPEGKALQGCTSHDLGQNFSKAQDIKFQDKEGKSQFVWQNSWGFATRAIGALLMAHGDDAGIVLPPKVASVQVVIIPVTLDEEVVAAAQKLAGSLEDMRVKVDTRDGESFGYKINKWELRGVPLRIEVGKKEMTSGKFKMIRRDTGEVVEGEVENILEQIQADMLAGQEKFLRESTHEAADYEKFKEIMGGQRGFIKAFWCENAECEVRIKEETKASTRCLPLSAKEEKGNCIYCGKDAKFQWVFAQAY
ncbi:MAG: Proline-tRNA ligase [Microgenomates group bacterium GW2011_GWA1_Microgenomates_45_10]|nr:MAG: Proline-tRNA ligase [Microgenomates group bacterium GW2011_GWA1_Microgenomates_45_10]